MQINNRKETHITEKLAMLIPRLLKRRQTYSHILKNYAKPLERQGCFYQPLERLLGEKIDPYDPHITSTHCFLSTQENSIGENGCWLCADHKG